MIRDWLRSLAGPDPDLSEARERAHAAEVRAEETQADLDALRVRSLWQVTEAHRARDVAQGERDRACNDLVAAEQGWLEEQDRLRRRSAYLAGQLLAHRNVAPSASDQCTKVPCHDRAVADVWRAKIAADFEMDPDEFQTYPCRVCPRNPVTGEHFWHVANARASFRSGHRADGWRPGQARTKTARAEGRLLGQRLDPVVAERLRGIAGEVS